MEVGDLVVRVISGAGVKTATIVEVFEVGDTIRVGDVDDFEPSMYEYDTSRYQQTESVIPGFTSYLVTLDDGEEDAIRQGFGYPEETP